MTAARKPGKRPIVALVLAGTLASAPAWAYDPATTHAGLTERAVLASSLHKVLSRRLGRPLGLLEPLQIYSRFLEAGVRKSLWARLGALDPAGGYRPGADGTATALSWVVAGAVLAKTPPERGRNHFFDPTTRKGLDDSPGLTGLTHELRLSLDEGASLRDMATGLAFDLTGHSSLDWIASTDNDAGLPALLGHLERSAVAPEAAERESALVRALLSLGGILAVLEDAGDPAHVRNDFRGAYLQRQSASSWDDGSAYERYVSSRYGRSGLPAASPLVRRPNLESYFTGSDGQGLADRTHRRFFSPGTVPEDPPVDPRMNTRDVLRLARESMVYPEPALTELSLKDVGEKHYLMLEGRRALGYVRVPGRVRFFLDDGVHADTAKAVLPEIEAYAGGLLDHLLRAGLVLKANGREVTAALEGASGSVGQAPVRFFGDDERGLRRELGSGAVGAAVAVPAGIKHVVAVLRASDGAGPFVALGEATLE
jgi:hypothetical protein